MFRFIAVAGVAALLSACAAPFPGSAGDPMYASRGSTPAGKSKAAALGFHGPVHREAAKSGAN